jgi:uncharacterized SAM-binding protein YcdF (DUF218 family)
MDMSFVSKDDGIMIPAPEPKGSGRSFVRIAVAFLIGLSGVVLVGFLSFVGSLDRKEPINLAKADGIVALTGGVDRIPDAVGWLALGNGERLLISGVSTQTSVERLVQSAPRLKNWLNCCVDLDHQARNTVGNAEETRRWATAKGYRSLLVVTSSYHMPRAMVELQRSMPEINLIAAPVVTERLQELGYWKDPDLLRILFHEYAKFMVSYARACLTSPSHSDDITADINRRRA